MAARIFCSSAAKCSKQLKSLFYTPLKDCNKIPPMFASLPVRAVSNIVPPEGIQEPPIPPYAERQNEECEIKRARLLYQSRKRGMTENGLLLSTFAAKYLDNFSEKELKVYDKLINQPSNDWEIYYWVTGAKPTPSEFDSEIMNLLKEHAKNTNKDVRSTQPDLY